MLNSKRMGHMVEMNHSYFLGGITRFFKRGKGWVHYLQNVNVMGYRLEIKLYFKLQCYYWFHGNQSLYCLRERQRKKENDRKVKQHLFKILLQEADSYLSRVSY